MTPLVQSAFDVLQRPLAKALNVPSESVTPDARLDDLVPTAVRRRVWREVAEELQIQLPKLWFSPLEFFGVVAVAALLWLVGAAAVVGCDILLFPQGRIVIMPLGLPALVPLAAVLAGRLLADRARWAPEIETIEDLARITVAANMKTFRLRYGVRPNCEEIFQMVKIVLVDALGVDEDEVTPDARLVQDLGAE